MSLGNVRILSLEELENSPSPRYGHSTCIVDKFLYLFGGCSPDGKLFFNDLYILDLEQMKWIECISGDGVIVGRHFHTCTHDTKSSKLCFFGGKSNGYKNDVFTFDLSTKKFEVIEPKYKDKEKKSSCINDAFQPPSPRYGHSSCYYDDRIFIFGGYDTNGFTRNDLYCFNLVANMWRKYVIAQIPYRYHHSSCLIGNDYFIIGGVTKQYTPLNDIYRLDLSQTIKIRRKIRKQKYEVDENDDHAVEAFEVSVQNPVSSYGHKTFLFNNSIYLYGGRDEDTEFRHLLKLETGEKSLRWKPVLDRSFFDESKLEVSYCSIDMYENQILFFGGQHRGKNIKKKQKLKKKEEEEEEVKNTDDIPYDCIYHILENFLQDERDLIQVASVSKKSWSFSIAARSDRIWLEKYERAKNVSPIDHIRMKRVRRQKNSYRKYMVLRTEEKLHEREELKNGPKLLHSIEKLPDAENIKTVIVGDGAIGKTCLLMRYGTQRFPDDYVPTVFSYVSALSIFREKKICLQLWDTAGEEDYDRLRPLSYPETDVFIVAFSLIDPTSLENIYTKWYPELMEHSDSSFNYNDHYRNYRRGKLKTQPLQKPTIPFVLVGTKVDLREDLQVMRELRDRDEKPVTKSQGEKLAKEIHAKAYFETSAKTGENVSDLFKTIIALSLGWKEEEIKKNNDKCGIM